MDDKKVTDLEAVAIGFVLRNQPCTAHFIRTCFKKSQTSHFSDSAGSVYPMMRRLAEAQLVSVHEKQEGQRRVAYFRCTKQGQKALKSWLNQPFPDLLGFDLLRTQILYLDRLTLKQQKKWFDEARSALQEKLDIVQSMLADAIANPKRTTYEVLAHENAIFQLKARLKWLAKCAQKILDEKRNSGRRS